MSAAFISKNSSVISLERRWAPESSRVRSPAVQANNSRLPVVGVMVRVVMSDEDVPDGRERHTRQHELTRDSVAAIHNVRRIIGNDDLSRRRSGRTWPRPTGGSKEDQLGLQSPSTRPGCDSSRGCQRQSDGKKRTTIMAAHR